MSLRDELIKQTNFGEVANDALKILSDAASESSRAASESLGAQLARISAPDYWTMPELSPATLQIRRPGEWAAESFMDGLRAQAADTERGVRENQELRMFFYHGPEKLRVLEISMPSDNVVCLRCLDENGEDTHVTGHMHSVTFTYFVHTIVPPEVRRRIGFIMPSEDQ